RRARAGAIQAVGAIVLSLGIAAIYWVPALVEMPYSRISDQRMGSFSLGRYLSQPGDLIQSSFMFAYNTADQHRYGLISFMLTLVAIGAIAVAAARTRSSASATGDWLVGPDRLVLAGAAVVFVVVLGLQLRAAQPIWDTVPL